MLSTIITIDIALAMPSLETPFEKSCVCPWFAMMCLLNNYNTHTKVRHRKSEFGSSIIIAYVGLSHSLTVLCQ